MHSSNAINVSVKNIAAIGTVFILLAAYSPLQSFALEGQELQPHQHIENSMARDGYPGNTGYEPWYYYVGGVINAGNGNLYVPVRDLSIHGRGFVIDVHRSYNSHASNISTALGYGWTFTYATSLQEQPDGSALYTEPDGTKYTFTNPVNGIYQKPPGMYGQLKKEQNGTYHLRFKEGTTYTFNSSGVLQQITDKNANHLTCGYTDGDLTSVSDDSGIHLILTYDTSGRITNITDPLGRTIQYTYDGNGDLTSVADAAGNKTRYRYDGDHRLIAIIDRNNRVLTFTYNGVFSPPRASQIGNSRYNVTTDSYPPPYTVYDISYDPGKNTVIEKNRGRTYHILLNSDGAPVSVTDPLNQSIRYTWDSNMNLVRYTDKIGNNYTYTYEAYGNLLSRSNPMGYTDIYGWTTDDNESRYLSRCMNATDRNGHTTRYTYDSHGNMNATTNARGDTIHYEYDSHGYLTKITDARGNATTYTYDAHGFLLTETDVHGNTSTYTHDAVGRLVNTTNAQGDTILKEYNANDYLIRRIDPLGQERRYLRDAGNFLIGVIDETGKYTNYSNNYLGEPDTIRDASGNTTSYQYDKYGNQVKIINPRGQSMSIAYDILGRVTSITDAHGNAQSFTYDAKNNILSETDRNGYTDYYTYDTCNRLTSITNALGYTTQFIYDGCGNIVQTIDAKKRSSTYSYDDLNRLITFTDASGNSTQYGYDSNDNLISTTDAGGYTTTYGYDELNRRVSATDAVGNTRHFRYDSVGNLLALTDENNHTTTYSYDPLGRCIRVTDALGNHTSYVYDSSGNIVNVTDANNHSTTYTYDDIGRLTTVTSPLGYTTRYAYDSLGNVVRRTDANGNQTTYTYDGVNRLAQTIYPDGTGVTYEYDAAGNVVKIQHFGGMYDTTTYEYDPLGRRISACIDYGGAFNKTLRYSYDQVGNRVNMTDPEGNLTTYTYDVLDRLVTVTDPFGDVTQYTYDSVGNRIRLDLANGDYTTYQYDGKRRLTNITNRKADDTVISRCNYSYDGIYNRIRVERENNSISTYQYDPLNRLIQEAGTETTQYSYDPVGNRIGRDTDGSSTTYTYDADDRLLSTDGTSYTYNPAGNLVQQDDNGSISTYTYDYENRLTGVHLPGGTNISYAYSPEGYRLQREVETPARDDINRVMVPDSDCLERVLMELDGTGNSVARYTHGLGVDTPISMRRDGATYYYGYDGLGSVTYLIDPLDIVQARYTYDAFGCPTSETGTVDNPYRFTGRAWENETQQYFYRARYYDPFTGRFTSKDPVDAYRFGGTTDDPPEVSRAQRHPYTYVDNNPVNYVDPSGRWIIGYVKLNCMYAVRGFNDALAEARGALEEKKAQSAFRDMFPNEMETAGNFWEPGRGPLVRSSDKKDDAFYKCKKSAYGFFQPCRPDVFISQWLLDALCNEKLGFWERHQIAKKIMRTLVHETGHWVDDQNKKDTAGEEGEAIEDAIFGNGKIGDTLSGDIIRKLKDCANPPPPVATPSPVPTPAGKPSATPTPSPSPVPTPSGQPVPTPRRIPTGRPSGEPRNIPTPTHMVPWGGSTRWGPVPTYPGDERLFFMPWNDTGIGEPSNIHDGDYRTMGPDNLSVTVMNNGDDNVTAMVDFTLERWNTTQTVIIEEGFEAPLFPPDGWLLYHEGNQNPWYHETGWGHNSSSSAGMSTIWPPVTPLVYDEWLVTPGYDFTNISSPVLSLWYYNWWMNPVSFGCELQVWASTDGGNSPGDFMTSGMLLYDQDLLDEQMWIKLQVDAGALAGESDVHFALAVAGVDNTSGNFIEVYIDDVLVEGMGPGWTEVDSGSNGPYELDPEAWVESFFDVCYDMEGAYRATFSLDTPVRANWSDDDPGNDVYQAAYTVVNDTAPPAISAIQATPSVQYVGGTVNISCIVTDDTALDAIHVNISDPGGYAANISLAHVPGTDGYYHNTSYATIGTFSYTIWARDVVGNQNVSSAYTFDIVPRPPVAAFTYAPSTPTTMDTVVFTDTSTDSDGSIVAWHWAFGDGGMSTQQHPTHRYTAGTYQVNLTVWDNDGASNTTQQSITVTQPTVDSIIVTYSTGNAVPDCNISADISVPLYAAAYNSTYGYLGFIPVSWSIGNTGSNASLNTSHGPAAMLYSGWNNGTATVTADDGSGHSDSVTFTVNTSLFTTMYSQGWNLMTVPCSHTYNASSLGQAVPGCSIVAYWNAASSMFQSFLVGISPPGMDFAVQDGVGYFIYVANDTVFSQRGAAISGVNVSLAVGWNTIGWYNTTASNASSLGSAIDNCTIVAYWNATSSTFASFLVGISPPAMDFHITRGMGIFIYVTASSTWHGDG
jgi:RHS repeat-associated protein